MSINSNLKPGGWIEEVEIDIIVNSDDETVPPGSTLEHWGPNFLGCAERADRPLNTEATMRASIEKAGFVNVHEKIYKCPLGGWPKDKLFKDAGRVNMEHWKTGLEGWAMWLLTKHGAPTPWNHGEVMIYVAKMRASMTDPKVHGWHWGYVLLFTSFLLVISHLPSWSYDWDGRIKLEIGACVKSSSILMHF